MNLHAPKFSKSLKAVSVAATSLAMIVSFQNCSHDQDGGFSSDANTQMATSLSASLSPSAAEIQAGSPQTISSADAPAGAKFYLVSGDGSVDPDTGVYTAPMHATVAVIGLKSGDLVSTRVSTIKVSIPNETITFSTSASSAVVAANSDFVIGASGGHEPYTYSLKDGSVAKGTFHQGLGIFHATDGGSATIVVTDAFGVTAEIQLIVSSQVQGQVSEGSTLTLSCPTGTTIQSVDFLNYGLSTKTDSGYEADNRCAGTFNTIANMSSIQNCQGKSDCSILASNDTFGDPCDGTPKNLTGVVTCSVAVQTSTSTNTGNSEAPPLPLQFQIPNLSGLPTP